MSALLKPLLLQREIGTPNPGMFRELNCDFTDLLAVLDARITATRASSAWYWDENGDLQEATTDQMRAHARVDHDPDTGEALGWLIEEQRTNSIRNPRGEGGAVGEPGTPPTYWIFSDLSGFGLTEQVVGYSLVGEAYEVEVRISGTCNVLLATAIEFEATGIIAAVNGNLFTQSCQLSLSGGTISNVTSITLSINQLTSGAASTGVQNGPDIKGDLTASLKPFSMTYTVNNGSGTTAFIRPRLRITIPSGGVVDFTIKIKIPRIEQGAFATSIILPPVSSPAATIRAGDVPVFVDLSELNFNAEQGTIVWELVFVGVRPSSNNAFWSLNDGTSDNRMTLYVDTNGVIVMAIYLGGVLTGFLTTGVTAVAGTPYRVGLSWIENSVFLCMNGTNHGEDVIVAIPPVTQLQISRMLNGNVANSWHKDGLYIPTKISQETLRGLTEL